MPNTKIQTKNKNTINNLIAIPNIKTIPENK